MNAAWLRIPLLVVLVLPRGAQQESRTMRVPKGGVVGRYRLVTVGGRPLGDSLRDDLRDACWYEVLAGSLTLRADGTYHDTARSRGGCGERGRQLPLAGRGKEHAGWGRYTIRPDSLRLLFRDEQGRWIVATSGIVRGDTVFTGYDEDQVEHMYVRTRPQTAP